jgi:tetratricopeptide (TPR) repeat protein
MRHWKAVLAVVAMAGMLAVGASAQVLGRVSGQVIDANGKPWPGVTVVISSSSTGAKYTVTTDSKGEYMQMGVQPGIYKITFETNKFPPQTYEVQVQAGSQLTQNINFKKLLEANPQYVAAMKKEAAEKKAFANLKQHFDAGRKAIDQANALSNQLESQPAAQQAQTRQQIAQLSQTAITELTAAEKAAGPTNSNLPTILGNLALAYQTAGNHTEAAATFTKASQMQPTNPGYLLGAATNLAYSGKTQEAGADCEKIAAVSVPTAATCWRNLGVVLYNTNHLKDAVDPLKKATQADPTDADTWYLLGSALMNSMQSKMVNGKLTAIVAPGTVEAYQKYLELAPNGPQAPAAKQALQVLQQLGAGVNTKFIAPKKKH